MSAAPAFSTLVQEDLLAVEALIRRQAEGYHPDLRAALDLLLSAGGKRIRPTLTLLIGKMLGAPHSSLITLAASIELLHTATLVHDDLIDSALLRRGHETLNSKWSPGATVLTGDFLFACAAKLAADANSIPVTKLFARTLTIIVNGEISQLFSNRCLASREEYYRRIYAKTGSLFETSTSTPAMISPVDAAVVENLRVYGYEIGIAFQIIDDILDFTGQQATIGKPVGSDLRQGLVTLPALFYVENNPDDPTAQALVAGKCPHEGSSVDQLIQSIRGSKAIAQAHQEAHHCVERAVHSLTAFPDGPERHGLEEIAAYIVQRDL